MSPSISSSASRVFSLTRLLEGYRDFLNAFNQGIGCLGDQGHPTGCVRAACEQGQQPFAVAIGPAALTQDMLKALQVELPGAFQITAPDAFPDAAALQAALAYSGSYFPTALLLVVGDTAEETPGRAQDVRSFLHRRFPATSFTVVGVQPQNAAGKETFTFIDANGKTLSSVTPNLPPRENAQTSVLICCDSRVPRTLFGPDYLLYSVIGAFLGPQTGQQAEHPPAVILGHDLCGGVNATIDAVKNGRMLNVADPLDAWLNSALLAAKEVLTFLHAHGVSLDDPNQKTAVHRAAGMWITIQNARSIGAQPLYVTPITMEVYDLRRLSLDALYKGVMGKDQPDLPTLRDLIPQDKQPDLHTGSCCLYKHGDKKPLTPPLSRNKLWKAIDG